MSLSTPDPEGLPAGLAERVSEYRRVFAQRNAAMGELGRLEGSADQARTDDARALSDAAHAGADVGAVGTPAQDKLATDIRRYQSLVEGLSKLEADLGFEIKTAMQESSGTAIEMTREHAKKLRQPYLDAIEAVANAARAYDRTLYSLAGWLTFIQSGGRHVSFGDGGSIKIDGVWIDPFNVDTLTAGMRTHSRRLDQIIASIDKATAPPPSSAHRTREQSLGGADAMASWSA